MIIDFNRTVSYVCPGCGDVAYGKFSLFELSGGRSISVSCDCGKSSLKISYKNDKVYSITVGCQVCEKEHEYAVPLTELLHQQLLEFSCPELLMGLVFIGDEEKVKRAVEENNKYINEILATCEMNGNTYYALVPAGSDEDSEFLEYVILKLEKEEDGEEKQQSFFK